VSKELDARLQAVITALQTMLRKHPSLYTIDIVSALKDLQIKTRSMQACQPVFAVMWL